MMWLQFLISAVVVVIAAVKLAEYGDVIAVRTRLSGMFIGTLLLAGATSLPELLSAINALALDSPDLAAGSMFGSSMFNMFMLGVLDLLNQQSRILRQVAMNHALTASLASLLMIMAIFFIMADIDLMVGWVGVDSLLIILAYAGGIRLIQQQGGTPPADVAPLDDKSIPSLGRAFLGFGAATTALVFITPFMVDSANQIAVVTALGTGFIGATLVAITTSLPEMVATIAAVRIRAFDLAVGNLFGSNLFNMFALALTDFFLLDGRFLAVIDFDFALVGMIGLGLTALGLIGNIARVERRLVFLEIDALLILIVYFVGMYFLYTRGIGL
jgi:cation:H+ antiporter